MEEPCTNCGRTAEICAFNKRNDQWYAKYRCVPCNRAWELRLDDWSPVERAAWYRDNVLTREGLKSTGPMPWAAA